MFEWQKAFEVENGVDIDGKTGVIHHNSNPSVNPPADNVPVSTICIRSDIPELWQKTGTSIYEWELLQASTVAVPELYIWLLLRNEVDRTKIPLNTDLKLQVLLRNGSTTAVNVEV